ncbi:MAG: outer membrane lipoprotein carrier protein LolA [Treponema sp.]|jgi:outer membrane lipoprotein-sorting protein|nr:outer membrane lipoprotein carrier protein LolA [Treponema sp.]
MKKLLLCALTAMLALSAAVSQTVQTASEFFKAVSDFYGTIKDYEANVNINMGKSGSMSGKVSFKRPEMLRIDCTVPAEQVILFNGETLTVYLPGSSAILQQSVSSSGVKAGTPEGLALMRRYYTVAYETGQDAVPLEDGSSEMVVKLVLRRRSASEQFVRINLAVNPSTKLIRRLVGTTSDGRVYTFDFKDYNLNTGMGDQRFLYDPPSSANIYNNFLYSE